MSNESLKIYLQKIKELSEPFYQSMADKCRQAHQKYLENQRLIAQQNLNSRIQMQHDILQNDFAFVLENFTYPKLVQVTSKADLRQDGYKITKDYIIYYFTIDKTIWEKFPVIICNIIRENMNKDIVTFTKELAGCMTAYEIMCLYPALYWGFCVLNIEDQHTYIRLAVITKMPL